MFESASKHHLQYLLYLPLFVMYKKFCRWPIHYLLLLKPGMWKRLFFKRFRFHTYRFRFRFRFHRFRFHQQKTKERPLTIFFNFCGSVACLLLHFIILRKPKPLFIAITLPTSLKLIVSNYSVFFFLRYQNSC